MLLCYIFCNYKSTTCDNFIYQPFILFRIDVFKSCGQNSNGFATIFYKSFMCNSITTFCESTNNNFAILYKFFNYLFFSLNYTLDNAFIILDEAQNTTPAQMKMFLTRIGFGSKVVITGDITQKDLPAGAISGLDVATKVVKNIDDISICKLTSKDVVRHPLVQKIVKAYEEFEKKADYAKNKRKKS